MSAPESMVDRTVAQFLADIAERTPAPGGGAVAAIAVAMAAALAEMAARFSDGHWEQAGDAAARAADLRQRAEPLAQADAEAYAAVLAAPRAEIRAALAGAAAVSLAVAEVAAEVGALAAAAAGSGNPNLRGDAVTAALLAAAGARAAATLVEINLDDPSEERVARARRLADDATAAAALASS